MDKRLDKYRVQAADGTWVVRVTSDMLDELAPHRHLTETERVEARLRESLCKRDNKKAAASERKRIRKMQRQDRIRALVRRAVEEAQVDDLMPGIAARLGVTLECLRKAVREEGWYFNASILYRMRPAGRGPRVQGILDVDGSADRMPTGGDSHGLF